MTTAAPTPLREPASIRSWTHSTSESMRVTTESPQLLIHIFNRLAVDIEMIPEPLGGEVAGLLRVGGGSDGIKCHGSQFLGKIGHRRGCLIQLPDLVSRTGSEIAGGRSRSIWVMTLPPGSSLSALRPRFLRKSASSLELVHVRRTSVEIPV